MKERTIVKCIAALMVAIVVLVTGNTDFIYVGAGVLFFGLCIAYAEWCERL